MQLGGPRIMGVNGVSHHLVADDLEGARKVLAMLAFAPPELGSGPANLGTSDPISRQVTYLPMGAEKFDPRAAFAGESWFQEQCTHMCDADCPDVGTVLIYPQHLLVYTNICGSNPKLCRYT